MTEDTEHDTIVFTDADFAANDLEKATVIERRAAKTAVDIADERDHRATILEKERSDRAVLLARSINDDAIALAERRARREGVVDSHLAEHDRHLAVINGSIHDTAEGLKSVDNRLINLSTLISNQATRELADVKHREEEREERKEANEAMMTRANKSILDWSPFTRILAFIAVIGPVVTLGLIVTGNG